MRRNRPDPVRDAANRLDGIASIFDFVGFADAARNLRHFRSGQGTPQFFSDEEIEDHDPVMDAEDTNRSFFESRTFTGIIPRSKALLDLEDGETVEFEDQFHRRLFGETISNAFGEGVADKVEGLPTIFGVDLGKVAKSTFEGSTRAADAALNPGTFSPSGGTKSYRMETSRLPMKVAS